MAMMSGSNRSCMLCDHDYNERDKKPLMLPCGHSFCEECFGRLASALNHLCPVCRRDWSEWQVESLPVCYQLLPEQGGNDPYLCLKHNNHMTIWCSSCQLRVCLDCCWQGHLKCSWKPVKKAIADLLDDIGPRMEEVRDKLSLWESHAEKLSRFSRQLTCAITENMPDLRLLEDVSKMMAFYSRNVHHICEQIRWARSDLRSLVLNHREEDLLDQLTVLEEKMTALDRLRKEPEWPQVPRNSFLRIMHSIRVIEQAFDQLSATSNELPKAGALEEANALDQVQPSVIVASKSGGHETAVTTEGTDGRGGAGSATGTDLCGTTKTSAETSARNEAETAEESNVNGEISSTFDSEEENKILYASTNAEEFATTSEQAPETNSATRLNSSTGASGPSSPAGSLVPGTAGLEAIQGCVPADHSSLTLSQTSSSLISSLASSLRSSTHVDPRDPDLYFFKGILPDVKKLSNSDKMLFKQRVLVRLNALLSGDTSL